MFASREIPVPLYIHTYGAVCKQGTEGHTHIMFHTPVTIMAVHIESLDQHLDLAGTDVDLAEYHIELLEASLVKARQALEDAKRQQQDLQHIKGYAVQAESYLRWVSAGREHEENAS